jgi:glycerol-3-phosphate acyltransferase PlsY
VAALVAVGLAYLIGAIPTSYLVAKYGGGIDLRRNGSGNLGATNLYRALGWKFAVPVGIFDMTKGYVPVVFLAPRIGDGDWAPVAIGLIAVLGHVYPVYLGFVGGKGVATAAGVVLAVAPVVTAVSVVVWVLLLWSTGFSSVASISGALAFPIAALVLIPQNTALLTAGLCLAAFIVFTHRANIRRLLAGTESRFRRDRQQT